LLTAGKDAVRQRPLQGHLTDNRESGPGGGAHTPGVGAWSGERVQRTGPPVG